MVINTQYGKKAIAMSHVPCTPEHFGAQFSFQLFLVPFNISNIVDSTWVCC